ncbi:MAG: hypothetical protein ACI8UO_006409 [Verrucomicrobiales bacterium]|jgi:hypothetical protein
MHQPAQPARFFGVSTVLFILIAILMSTGLAANRTSDNYTLSGENFDSGGAATSAIYSLRGSLPPISGSSSSLNYQIRSGVNELPDLDAPANFEASDGLFTDRVRLQWDPVTSAVSYQLFRHTADDFATATQIGVVLNSLITFDDLAPPIGQARYYWVRAIASGFDPAVSDPDVGYTSDDTDGDQIADTWEQENIGNLDSAAADDHDLDGWTLLEEFALGGDPLDPSSGPDIRPETVTIGPNEHFGISFVRRKARAGLIYETALSSNLSNWSGTGLIEHIAVDIDANYERVTILDAAPILGVTRKFGRVDVAPAP